MGPAAGLGCIASPVPSKSLLKFKNEKAQIHTQQINSYPALHWPRKIYVGKVVAFSLRGSHPRKKIESV